MQIETTRRKTITEMSPRAPSHHSYTASSCSSIETLPSNASAFVGQSMIQAGIRDAALDRGADKVSRKISCYAWSECAFPSVSAMSIGGFHAGNLGRRRLGPQKWGTRRYNPSLLITTFTLPMLRLRQAMDSQFFIWIVSAMRSFTGCCPRGQWQQPRLAEKRCPGTALNG